VAAAALGTFATASMTRIPFKGVGRGRDPGAGADSLPPGPENLADHTAEAQPSSGRSSLRRTGGPAREIALEGG